jgi:riboflavin kinase/FMN adenylyltransferase
MKLVRLGSLAPQGWPDPAVTIGNFDGVHRGHQSLVEVAVRDAGASSGTAVVLTFEPHPSAVLSPDRAPSTLMTVEQKAEALASLGADYLVVLPFTQALSHQTPEEFARLVLRDALGARGVVVGSNFRFGRGRRGDVATLRRLGESMGYRVHGLDPVFHDGAPISSTRIREALARGAVEAAGELLGRLFFVEGTVVRGDGRGRSLGFPTANLELENETLPGGGVYAGWCRIDPRRDGPPVKAVANIGRRPTFGGGRTSVEAHLLDFAEDFYGCRLRLEFQARLREERRFAGPEELREQIGRDVAEARGVLAG